MGISEVHLNVTRWYGKRLDWWWILVEMQGLKTGDL
jgi:hypothetical protein